MREFIIRLGVAWLVLGVLVLAQVTRGLRHRRRPEMTATEKATVEAAA